MTNNFVRHNEALMPMPMGSPARTPSYARSAWGLPTYIKEEEVVELYSDEWKGGNEGQLAIVSKAAKRAGFGDNPALLRQKTAEVIRSIIKGYPIRGELLILDVGAGPGLSALTIWKELPTDIRSKSRFLLLDPSRASLEAAEKVMKENRVNYEVICDVDIHVGRYLKEGIVDILVGVASVHHHSAIPFDLYYQMLTPGGIAVFADWHNSIWEHPWRVYRFLEAFDWPTKEAGLREWLESYGGVYVIEPTDPADRQANKDITNFWLGYYRIIKEGAVDLGPNSIWPLEGHRPVEQYVAEMRGVGFSIDSSSIRKTLRRGIIASNPHQLLPGSRLLMVTVGEKTRKGDT
jgi:SAM-dependent methyltransferase